MRCPSCGADVVDPEGLYCSRCGHPLERGRKPPSEVPAGEARPGAARVGDSGESTAALGLTRGSQKEGRLPLADPEHRPTGHDGVESTAELAAGEPGAPDETANLTPGAPQPGASQTGALQTGDLVSGAPQPGASESGAPQPNAARAGATPPTGPEPTGDPWSADAAKRLPRRRRLGGRRSAGTRVAGLAVPVRDLVAAVGRSVSTGGWVDAWKAASVAFLATLCVGAVLVVAGKLASPRIGAGASPISVLIAIVMVALGSLGVPVSIGSVRVAALPLGALALIAAVIAWAVIKVMADDERSGVRAGAAHGAKIGGPYALLMWAAALIFRFRAGPTPAAAGAGEALLLSAIWGAAFGALGGALTRRSLGALVVAPFRALKARSTSLYLGAQTGAAMLIVVAVGSCAALLLWVIVALLRGSAPPSFGVADAVSGVIFVAAFLPNILSALVAIALGAPVEVGAKVRFGGRELGPVETFSLSEWGVDGAPWLAWLLVLIPLGGCLLGGFAARRNADDSPRLVEVLGAAAITFATPLAVLAALADARLGAGLLRPRGFAHVAPDATMVFVLALLWAAGLGFAGWKIAETQSDEARGPIGSRTRAPAP
jgi:hypothetical protein